MKTNRRREPLSKAMLLPVPAVDARAISLENHLALVAMRSGQGNVDLVLGLFKIIYMAYFLHEALRARTEPDLFRDAEHVLMRTTARANRGEAWSIPAEDVSCLERIVTLYDRYLATLPAHRFISARDRLQRFLAGKSVSPIATGESS
ncbi:hypothetical protein [Paraburkholderia fungorum]|uniref:hypothetical protein n=1 Tax=Paraburkholderia fungorum TaxID=134537 RepID=UPI0020923AF4|nr:hypothetical protein [Paraburkholderia fungorum]USU14550.1 hypothetical protein NFE55_13020 [Paraburkholderia fungorum]USU22498.1 hypothetical protein NFS19_13020 [Paraburkholderia fungorum]